MTEDKHTYIFMDESGDAGFKFAKGSSPFFCFAAVIFPSTLDIGITDKAICDLRYAMSFKKDYEFHFCEESPKRRKLFCEAVATCPFTVRAVLVDKTKITDAELIKSPDHFYAYHAKELLSYAVETFTSVKVRIDGQMKRELQTYLRKELNKDGKVIHDTQFVDSARDNMIQLADMVAGGIMHSYRTDRSDHEAFLKILSKRINGIKEYPQEASQ